MDEKNAFIRARLSGLYTMSECCELFGISRQTGHKLWRRFKQEGLPGLQERSRAPQHHPRALDSQLAHRLCELRRKYPQWGPVKILHWFKHRNPELELPVPSTVGELFKREGLVRVRKRRSRPGHQVSELGGYFGPNAVWCADYKGQFRIKNGKLCYPLTISDGYSRALLRCHALERPETHGTKRVFEAAFREYGIPDAIRTDNGSPFSSTSGVTQLSIWWVQLGIRPLRITPGRPSQNGRHERIHRTMDDELLGLGVEANLRAQQHAFDRFTELYNQERPHQAMNGKTPASMYHPSTKRYPTKLREPDYPDDVRVERVSAAGGLTLSGTHHLISPLLAGHPVGIRIAEDATQLISYGPILLGHITYRGRFKRGAVKKPHPKSSHDPQTVSDVPG